MRKTTALLLYFSLISQSKASLNLLEDERKKSLTPGSEFIFENFPNQELISIRLIGSVKNPGIYHIPNQTKLTTLISLAGGTNQDADLENIIIRNDSENNDVNKLNLEELISNKKAKNDNLNGNDIVFVQRKKSFIDNEITNSLSVASIILTSVLTALLIKEKSQK